MVKNYIDYCREAVKRDPKTYGSIFNEDGTRKKEPSFTSVYKKKVLRDVPREYLKSLERDGWTPCPEEDSKAKPPDLIITGTEIVLKGRKQNLTLKKIPPGCSKKEYNKIWMHNDRVRKRLNMLKEQYGVTKQI